ncbi:WD repeat-containing protein [Sorangium cellulosum]|uniref:WD repeat-containing protein n=1 Tax=Sorangium cellulosum TaxID=56 RepID=A0A4P2Q0U4_SORCE|nr:AAA family ATPase [Sorangium cellulosum]AUX22443.1 WD repeat-containing protein [Sorangium cellulosum]
MSGAINDFDEERSRHGELLGRDNVVERLLSLIEDRAPIGGWVLFLGSPGAGKSAIINRLLELLPPQTPHHFIRRDRDGWDRPDAVVHSLCAQIERIHAEQASLDQPIETRLGELLWRLSKRRLVPQGDRLVLVIDGLDEAAKDRTGKSLLPRYLPRVPPKGVVVLCASRPMYRRDNWMGGLERARTLDLDDDEWATSNKAACRAICEQRARSLTPPLDAALIDRIVDCAQGNMLYASGICDWLAGQPPARRTAARISQGLFPFLRQIFDELRALGNARRALILKGLGLACAAREALPPHVFGELLSGDPTTAEIDEFLRATFHLLRKEPALWHDGHFGYRLRHERVREVFVDELGARVIRDHHRHLVGALAAWPPDEGDPSGRRYALRHAVMHRIEARDVAGAQRLCVDISYLDAKCRELDVNAIERDLEAVIGASEGSATFDLTAVLAAVRAEASRLSAYREQGLLPSLLYNRLRCAGWPPEEIARMLHFEGNLPPLRLLHGVRLGPTPLRTFSEPTKAIVACVVSPDGRSALSASADRTLRYWRLVSGEVLATMQGHSDELTGCAFTPDGRLALSTSIDMTARLWDLTTGHCVRELTNQGRWATACAVSHDGRTLVVGSDNGALTLWDRSSLQVVHRLERHGDYVTACITTPAGQLVSGSRDARVLVWDLASGAFLQELSPVSEGRAPSQQATEQGWITALALMPGGEQVLAASGDGTLSRWDLATGRCVQRVGACQGRVDALAILPWGSHLLCGMADGAIAVWDLAAERRILRLAAHANAVSACAATSDGRRMVSASHDRSARLWELGGPESLMAQDGHAAPVTAAAMTLDGRLAVSASEDRLLKLWDTATGGCRATLAGHADLVTACAVSPDGRRVLAGARDGGVLLFQLDLGRSEVRVETTKAHQKLVSGCAFLPDGRMITASHDGALWLRSGSTLDQPSQLGAHDGPIDGIALTPDGTRLLSFSRDGTVKLWHLGDASRAPSSIRLTGGLLAGAMTPDGGRVVLARADGLIEVRELPSWRYLRGIPDHTRRVFGCAVSPDGARVITASEDETVRAFCLKTGRPLGTLVGTSWFRCIAAASGLFCAGDEEGNLWMIADGLHTTAPLARESTRRGPALSRDDIFRLRDTLTGLYDTEHAARRVVKDADVPLRGVTIVGSILDIWHAIVEEARKRHRLAGLVRCALREYPDDDVLLELAQKLDR